METLKANVRTGLLDELAKRIEKKINKPARKLSLPEAVIELGKTSPRFFVRQETSEGARYSEISAETKARRDDLGKETFAFEFTEVTIIAAEPKLAGWKFVGTIEHTEAGNILRSAAQDNQTLPVEYRTNTNTCDHCKTNRRRKDTYIVRHVSFGEYFQVGRSCIKDFLGHGDPERVASYFNNLLTLWSDLASEPNLDDEYFVRVPRIVETLPFLAVVAESIRTNGWAAKSAWDKIPTADSAWAFLVDVGVKPASKLLDEYGFDSVSNESRQTALDAREWAAANSDTDNDYFYNLKVACALEAVTARRAGIVASAVSSYQRHLSGETRREVERVRKAAALPVPVTDDRIEITGTVINTKWQEGYTYNAPSVLKVTVLTTEGWRVWGSAPSSLLASGDDVVIGDVICFQAKVSVSDNDSTFGFYKRPTRASYVSRAADKEGVTT